MTMIILDPDTCPELRDKFNYAPSCGLDPISKECIAKAKSWLSECTSAHPRCRVDAGRRLPRRVIDVRSGKGSDLLELVETNEQYERYITLSHCWGDVEPCKTTKGNIQNRLKGIRMPELPQIYQDAVFLAREFEIRYLWIDSLCIIQDDHDDWNIETTNMATIFGDSYLTIAASISSNCHHSILEPRPNAEKYKSLQPLYQGKPLPSPYDKIWVRQCLHERPHRYSSNEQGEDPLDSRLWAVQEQLLSTRVLSYRRNELTWQCKTHHGCECRGLDERYSVLDTGKWERWNYHQLVDQSTKDSFSEASRKSLLRWWSSGLALISQKKLSYESEKLSAISGVASSLQITLKDTYLAGMWKNDLSYSLGWRTSRTNAISDTYRAPSWCWSSLTDEFVMRDANYRFIERDVCWPKFTIIDVQCTPATQNPFGWVKEGAYLELSGHLLPATLLKTTSDQLEVHFRDLQPAFSAIGDYHVTFLADTFLAPALAHNEIGHDEVTPTRSNVQSRPLSALDKCPVSCLWLNVSYFSVTVDRLEFMVLGKSLTAPGAYTRLGLGVVYVPRFFHETFPKKEKSKLSVARLKVPSRVRKVLPKIAEKDHLLSTILKIV